MIYYFAQTTTTPEVSFHFSSNKLSIKGEVYPENANLFFQPILEKLESYLDSVEDETIEFNVGLTYFNSAATKMLYKMFSLLNDAALAGNEIFLNWYHDEEDITSLEFGEEMQEEFTALKFQPIVLN
jgi:hypothetical protein